MPGPGYVNPEGFWIRAQIRVHAGTGRRGADLPGEPDCLCLREAVKAGGEARVRHALP